MTHSLSVLSPRYRLAWRIAQAAVLLVGLGIVAALFVRPTVGLDALWNVLVPVAPALLVLAPGVWRNICPLGSTALLSRHMGLSKRRRLSVVAQGWFALAGVALLLLIVPLRHVVLNTNGVATGLVLLGVGAASIVVGLNFEWKSGWCSGLCPVHPVEKLYGIRPLLAVPNAHCTECFRCTSVCPDSTPRMDPLVSPNTVPHIIAGTVLVGGFPGFVWGWFQVSDAAGATTWGIAQAYLYPIAGLLATLAVYLMLRTSVGNGGQERLIRLFAAAAVACYYFFRLPMLVGFGAYAGEGMLVDLSALLPHWVSVVLRIAPVLFFGWLLLLRETPRRSWAARPSYAPGFAPGSTSPPQAAVEVAACA